MKKFILSLTALLMVFGVAVTASAAEYTPINGPSVTLKKYLGVDPDANIPAAEFTYTVVAGTAIQPTSSTEGINAGPTNGATIGKATFTAGEAATVGPITGVTGTDANHKYAVKDVSLDLTHVQFSKPGVYRYVVTETSVNPDSFISLDTEPKKTVDIYVTNKDDGTLEAHAVVYDGLVDKAKGVNEQNMANVAKDEKYLSMAETKDLEISKTVTGNLGDRHADWTITVNITGAGSGTVMKVDASNAVENATNAANIADVVADANGEASRAFTIRSGEKFKITGIPKGAQYTVSETQANQDGYLTTGEVKTATALNDDASVGVTNTKSTIVATGVTLARNLYWIGPLVIAGVILARNSTKKREDIM